jgi:hypothetical protein
VKEGAAIDIRFVEEFVAKLPDISEKPLQNGRTHQPIEPLDIENVKERLASSVYCPQTPRISACHHLTKHFLIPLQGSKQV